jgi:hypothetical protein
MLLICASSLSSSESTLMADMNTLYTCVMCVCVCVCVCVFQDNCDRAVTLQCYAITSMTSVFSSLVLKSSLDTYEKRRIKP